LVRPDAGAVERAQRDADLGAEWVLARVIYVCTALARFEMSPRDADADPHRVRSQFRDRPCLERPAGGVEPTVLRVTQRPCERARVGHRIVVADTRTLARALC